MEENLDHSTGSPRLHHFSLLLLYSDSSSKEQKPGSNPFVFHLCASTTLLSRAQSYENRTDRHVLAQRMAGGCLSDLIPLTNRIFLTSVTRFCLWISEKSQHSLGLLRLQVFISWPESFCHQRYCRGSLPDGSGVKNLLASAGRHRFNPWSGKISHAMKKLSMWATTVELLCALEPGSQSYWSSCPLKPATRGATAMRSPFPCLLHTEQEQQRPNTAKVNK